METANVLIAGSANVTRTGIEYFPNFHSTGKQMAAINNLVAMVGDTESDIILVNELGIISIGVLSGIRNKTMLDRYEPAYIINSVVNIEEILPNL